MTAELNEKQESEITESKDLESGVMMQEVKKTKEWTVGDLKDESRRFCLDLSPKVSSVFTLGIRKLSFVSLK